MKSTIFRIWFCLWPLFLGVFLPLFEFPGKIRLFNYFWEFIYGLGLFIIDKTDGLRIQSPYLGLGAMIWPAAVCAAMFLAAFVLDKMKKPFVRRGAIVALTLSSLLVTVFDEWSPSFWSGIPTYYWQMFNVW